MLKLKRLELSGFKSFVDPTDLKFAGGITAIVGPNGCGKSNLSDAMTWVLGEQSAKTLRGATMEDVIFNGSSERKPLGLAEVSLVLETDPSFPHSEEGELTIGRRVFRSGESQYRLNDRIVRLKEIKDTLMDTGLGIRAYSVIEQGKIGMILSGKPQERRRLLEEAAGITRYKARKRVAEVKLEEARANLLRLDDVVGEVERALRSLKRQANAARRYQEKQKEYRRQLEQVLLGRWRQVRDRLEVVRAELESALARDAELAADLHRREAELAAGREELDRLAEAVAERHKTVADLSATIEGRQQLLKSGRERVQEIAERMASGRALAERRSREAEERSTTLTDLEERRAEIDRELATAADAVHRDAEEVSAAERGLADAERRLEAVRAELLEAAAEVNRLRQRVHQGEIELEKANYRSHRLSEELAEHGAELAQAAEALEVATARVADLEGSIAERAGGIESLQKRLEEVLAQEARAADEVRRLEGRLSESRQRRKLLEELTRAHAERRTALEQALAENGIAEPAYLADRIRAVDGWERSLDRYLGELADAVVVDGDRDTLELARGLEERAAAQLVRPLADAAEAPEVDDPDVVLPLGRALGLDAALAAALPPAYLVSDATAAERLARSHRGAAFLAPEGLWFQGGVVHVPGRRGEPGILERERQKTELDEAIPRLEGELEAAEAELERLVALRSETAAAKNDQERLIAGQRQELAVARARKEDAVARHQRLQAEGEKLTHERNTLDTEIGEVRERQAAAQAEIQAAEARHGALQERFDRLGEEVREAKERRESLRESSAGRRGHLELLKERLESHDREMERLRREIDEGRRQAGAWTEEAERLTGRRSQLESDMERAEKELQDALERRDEVQRATLGEQEHLDGRRTAIRTLEGSLNEARNERDGAREAVEALRIKEAELKQEAGHVAGDFREEFRRDLPAPSAGEEDDEASADLAELEVELARTKATLERLGPVNVLAVEEYEEQKERHGFLTEQRADVEQSVESLKRTIREINQTSSERFRETFVEVNRSFGEVFTKLFRGGEAEMRLQDDEDPLESGIEIVARPPGKRLQNLMLLSGGEKALTAVALLFALFRTKPSPFCILDEVDAPLDDSNTVRFVEMLAEMAGDTQFLVITHNKITMEAASTLYGVTMEERGVSKLVSVELDDIHPETDAEQAATA